MKENAKAAVIGSFLADSLSLGVHWIYDVNRIKKEFGRVETFLKPLPSSYHPTKDRGEFTHYGDQTLVLLESLASKGKFDLEDFSFRWRSLFKDYHGYLDQATKATLQSLSSGKSIENAGSSSSDLAGAARIAPLIFRYGDDLEALAHAAATQTRMTHNNPMVVQSAEFFARVSWSVLTGTSPTSAMERVTIERFAASPLSEWVRAGIGSKDKESVATIGQFGQSCEVGSAFPSVVHLIAKYEKSFKEALIQCVISGGDSAGRGMIVGMVLGAHLGERSLPRAWLSSMKKNKEISELLSRVP